MRRRMAIPGILLAAALLGAAGPARAEDRTLVAPVTRIELAADGKSARATLRDEKGGEVTVTVTDELTLDKFKDKRIVEGDEIRVRFDGKDDARQSKSFKKTAGC
ncbi:MAG TPA: hypothetical protein VFK48_00335 [Usitatibacter sp.]|nr:hypothetical protein [Usitatibacter sp.]